MDGDRWVSWRLFGIAHVRQVYGGALSRVLRVLRSGDGPSGVGLASTVGAAAGYRVKRRAGAGC